MLANAVIQSLPGMLIVTAIGLAAGLAAIAFRPFVRLRGIGRRLAQLAIVIGIASPVLFFINLGPELLRTGRLILMSPIVPGLIAWVLYPQQSPEARGFEVFPPNGPGPGAG